MALVAAGATWAGNLALALAPGAARHLGRVNFHGRTVSLRGGLGAAAGAVTAGARPGRACAAPARPALAAVVATAAAGGAGLLDDLDQGAHDGPSPAKGLHGHLRALARGRVTTGVVKVAVIGSGALVGGVLLARGRGGGLVATAVDAAGSAVVIASWANLLNLLDLRPGRAAKAAVVVCLPLLAGGGASRLLASGALGTAAATLPEDLMERTMLGDTGANALGALVGTALAAHPCHLLRVVAAGTATALVLASEKVSFTQVIESTPLLDALDRCGRL